MYNMFKMNIFFIYPEHCALASLPQYILHPCNHCIVLHWTRYVYIISPCFFVYLRTGIFALALC